MIYRWRVHTRLPERFWQRCRVLVFGRRNSVLVEFADGHRVVTSRHYIRKVNAATREEQRTGSRTPERMNPWDISSD